MPFEEIKEDITNEDFISQYSHINPTYRGLKPPEMKLEFQTLNMYIEPAKKEVALNGQPMQPPTQDTSEVSI
jgi:hypothetical protein